jgi:stage II sporulation protein D
LNVERCKEMITGLRVQTLIPFLAAFLAVMSSSASVASENIRVLIGEGLTSITLQSSAGLLVEGAPRKQTEKKLTVHAISVHGPMRIRSRGGSLQMNGKAYRGTIEIRKKRSGTLLVINDLDLESYLLGVVAAEIPADWEMESLKAQAVASRTYALYQKQNAGRRPYHILATVDSQMYLGKRGERERAAQAVEVTRGMVITYQGQVIPAFYHASCGGHTEDALELWGIDEPYLKGVDCDCQNISKYGSWEKRVTMAGMIRALRREGYRLGDIGSVEIGTLTAAGRVKNVLFRHAGGTTSVPAETLRATLGYSSLPSIFFEPEIIDREVVLSGRGLGHGVGLCQWGAREMARTGAGFQAILAYYYPGTAISRRGEP